MSFFIIMFSSLILVSQIWGTSESSFEEHGESTESAIHPGSLGFTRDLYLEQTPDENSHAAEASESPPYTAPLA